MNRKPPFQPDYEDEITAEKAKAIQKLAHAGRPRKRAQPNPAPDITEEPK